jgi:hypothetical protein
VIDYLDTLQQSGVEKSRVQKKILCIIEGDLEFRYIVKIFKLFGYVKECYSLSEEFIKIAWGNNTTPNQNIVNTKCTFKGGGSVKGRKVPYPALDAFEMYADDLSVFESIIVFFDEDKDKLINHEVEKYFEKVFKNLALDNALVVSVPCFESTLVDFCICGACRERIDTIDDEKYPCDKYKNNFSKLECFEGVKHLIVNLDNQKINDLSTTLSKLNPVNNIIQNYMSKI